MKQLILHLATGKTELVEVPIPQPGPHELIVQSACSITSPGTERMLVNFGKAGWLQKARQQPDKVAQVLDKMRTDGVQATLRAVRSKMDQPIPLGYCNAGTVMAVGSAVRDFKTGDRVASNGPHGEIVVVSEQLAAKIPDGVSDEEAAFTVAGAIALQSIRLLKPTLGETFGVIGLGLIGQLTARLLRAHGCTVVATDMQADRRNLAAMAGITTIPASHAALSGYAAANTQHGLDGVIVAASADDEGLLGDCAIACRKRGRIVISGVVPMNLRRSDFYEKEISLQVSSSYGPGRYEPGYEEHGLDYPIGFVRWTARRNFEAVIQAMQHGTLDVKPLIPQPIRFEQAAAVYEQSQASGITQLFQYPAQPVAFPEKGNTKPNSHQHRGDGVAVIGAGAFSTSVLIPALRKADADLVAIASASGLPATLAARKFGFGQAFSDASAAIAQPGTGLVVIATRHDSHAALACEALRAGRHVHVEKPLALDETGLLQILEAKAAAPDALLHVGYNRRFASLAIKAKSLLNAHAPLSMLITINAGQLPANHWTHDAAQGGRIVGECGHFLDLLQFMTGSLIARVCALKPNLPQADSAVILVEMENGHTGTIHYLTNGSKKYDKERVEIYQSGSTLILENWKKLTGYGFTGFSSAGSGQDKGHDAQARLLVERVKSGGGPLIALEEIVNSTRATLAIEASAAAQAWVEVGGHGPHVL